MLAAVGCAAPPGAIVPRVDGRLEYVMSGRVCSADELAARLERYPGQQWLLQEHVRGPLGAVAGVAWRGALVCAIHQIARRTYPPDGPSAYAITVHAATTLTSWSTSARE